MPRATSCATGCWWPRAGHSPSSPPQHSGRLLFEAADIAAGLGDDIREADALLLMNRVFTSAT